MPAGAAGMGDLAIVPAMRIGVWACVLTATTVAAGWLPAVAGAEGFGGLPCHYFAPGAMIAESAHFNTTTGSPYTPPPAEFTDSEHPPLSNLSATANWGDGTTTPATISSEEECPQASASSHVYIHSGAYPFSYTIHDAHTGLDHVIGASTVYIWGLPQRVDAPSSHVIDATAGIPWSGTLGEFIEEPPPSEGASYLARIDWEGNGTWMNTTVTTAEAGRLVVTATHTFPAEFHGNTILSMRISEAEARWPVSVNVRAAPRYEFRDRQILAAIPSVKGRTTYEILFRLNTPLPSTSSDVVDAALGGGFYDSVSSFGRDKADACYAIRLTGVKRKLMSRRSLPFTLTIQQPVRIVRGRAELRRYASLRRMHSAADRQLGCA